MRPAELLNYRYLSEAELRGFDNYKYSSVDSSPIAVYISHPFWNQVVKWYPEWLAANVLTFAGMLLVFGAFGTVSWFDYWLLASSDTAPAFSPVPDAVWLLCAICTFCAHILDGTDGKQARRTGTSGPTGELFDHGIDSWLTLPFTIAPMSVFGRTDFSVSVFRQMLILMSVQLVFIVSHWEKYNTGVLFLPWGYDISQYFLGCFYLATYLLGGYRVWKFSLFPSWSVYPAHVAELLFYVACFLVSIPMSVRNLEGARREKRLKQGSWLEVLLPLLSTSVLFAATVIWAYWSPSGVLESDPRAFFLLFGTIFSNIACRLIVAQMTETRCEVFNGLLYPFVGLVGCAVLWRRLAVWELPLLRLFALFVTVAHLHYGVCVIRQMCNHFGISCFSVPRQLNPTPHND